LGLFKCPEGGSPLFFLWSNKQQAGIPKIANVILLRISIVLAACGRGMSIRFERMDVEKARALAERVRKN